MSKDTAPECKAEQSFLGGRVTLHAGDCRDVLKTLAENSIDSVVTRKLRSTPNNRHLEIGKAAEHLVCADLILSGHRAFLTEQGLPYDAVFDHHGNLFRVQVKSTARPKPVSNRPASGDTYMFNVKRAGKGGKRRISGDEFDLLALVALDIRIVAYIPIKGIVRQLVHLRVPGCSKAHGNKIHGNIDEYPILRALKEIGQ